MSWPIHPAAVRRLVPDIDGLEPGLRALAARTLADPGATSDTILLMADALKDSADMLRREGRDLHAKPVDALAAHLRDTAPDYAP